MGKNEEPKKIKIVSGSGKDLNISPVYDHLNVNGNQPQQKPKKNIVIPKARPEKKEEKNKEENSSDENNE